MAALERARKAVVGALAVALAYGAIAADVLGRSNLSTRDGIIAAVFDGLVAFGIWATPNKP